MEINIGVTSFSINTYQRSLSVCLSVCLSVSLSLFLSLDNDDISLSFSRSITTTSQLVGVNNILMVKMYLASMYER